jgi:hypothetical protein
MKSLPVFGGEGWGLFTKRRGAEQAPPRPSPQTAQTGREKTQSSGSTLTIEAP